jgi:RNA-directed DNA polymerase
MKESYVESLANYSGPESCIGSRKGAGEALTGVRVGWVLSRETTPRCESIGTDWGAEVVTPHRRQHWSHRFGKVRPGPARSEASCTHGNTLHGNREIPPPAAPARESLGAARIAKPVGVRR